MLVCEFSWRVYLAYRLAYVHLVFFVLRDRACPAAATSSAEPPVRGAALRFRNTSAVSSKHTYTSSSDRVAVHIFSHTHPTIPTDTYRHPLLYTGFTAAMPPFINNPLPSSMRSMSQNLPPPEYSGAGGNAGG